MAGLCFMAATSHEKQLFSPWGFPLPPPIWEEQQYGGFYELYGKRKPPWAKSLWSAEAALCLQSLRHKAPKWLTSLTHIFLADVITEENTKSKRLLKEYCYQCIFITRNNRKQLQTQMPNCWWMVMPWHQNSILCFPRKLLILAQPEQNNTRTSH